jgi:hypothetical protein
MDYIHKKEKDKDRDKIRATKKEVERRQNGVKESLIRPLRNPYCNVDC